MAIDVANFSEKKRSVLFARRLRAVAIAIVLGSMVVIGGHLPAGHDLVAHAAVDATPAAAAADADYFPSHFPASKGEPEQLPAQF